MKNRLIKALLGLTLGLSMFALTPVVNATLAGGDAINGGTIINTTPGSEDLSVVVGEIDVPVYNVTITWTSMQYNYKYNVETSSYEWVAGVCELIEKDDESNDLWLQMISKYDTLHTDPFCGQLYEGDLTEESLGAQPLYGKNPGGLIEITDNSSYGYVIPSIEWKPNENYKAVEANIKYMVRPMTYDSHGTQIEWISNDLILEGKTELPEDARNFGGCVGGPDGEFCTSLYRLELSLTTNPTLGRINPQTGDTLGVVTLTFEANSEIG